MNAILRDCLKHFKGAVVAFLIIGISQSFIGSLVTVYFQKIIDAIPHLHSFSALIPLFGIYVALRLVNHLLPYAEEYPFRILFHGTYQWAKVLAMKKISRIDFLAYQNLGTGKLIQTIENGAVATQQITNEFYLRVIREIIPTIVFSLIFIGFYSTKILGIILLGYIAVFAISFWLLRFLQDKKQKILTHEEDFSRFTVRGFMELVVFRLNGRFKSEMERIDGLSANIIQHKAQIRMVHELFFTIFAYLVLFIEIGIIYFQVKAIIAGTSTVGTLVALITFTEKVYQPAAIFNVMFVDFKLEMVSFRRFEKLLSLPDDKQLTEGALVKIGRGAIDLHDLSFDYGSTTLLDHFNLKIKGGASTALAGTTGSGKSTIAKLILGLLKPAEGNIFVDGQTLGQIALESYYRQVAYVSQDTPTFDGTIKENLLFGRNIPDQEIYEALGKARLQELIESLPQGLETEIGERGLKLSGGEKQRLAFARIFLQDPEIIILDEPTSALDSSTEEFVTNQMIESFKGKTLIIIAHRLQTIRNVDRIVVLEHGTIIQDGTFNSLIAKPGKFQEMWQKQSAKQSRIPQGYKNDPLISQLNNENKGQSQ